MYGMMGRSDAALRPTCSELGQRLSHAPREQFNPPPPGSLQLVFKVPVG
jgi:hypothetical protein